VTTHSFIDAGTLRDFNFKGKALLISDCEGYEKKLFTDELGPVLSPHDLLVEVHDFLDDTISADLIKQFKNTHNIACIRSIDDFRKAQVYSFPQLTGLDFEVILAVLSEYRPETMEWFYMKSRC